MSRGPLGVVLLALAGCAKLYSGPLSLPDAGAGETAAAESMAGAGGAGIGTGGTGGAAASSGSDGAAGAGGSGSGAITGGGTGGGSPADGSIAVTDALPKGDACPEGNCQLRATSVTVGEWHACALLVDGTVRCWGRHNQGQLGGNIGIDTQSFTPIPVPGVANAVAVAAGANHTCAVSSDGRVQCWGNNRFGQLGDNMTEDQFVSVADKKVVTVEGARGATSIALGAYHACVVMPAGSVRCWGAATFGQLAGATFADMEVKGLAGVTAIAAGASHTCARLRDGSVWCWGRSNEGQLGNGRPPPDFGQPPTPVQGLANVVSITAGASHTCALLDSGSVHCWGEGTSGQLGDGSMTELSTPVAVKGLPKTTALAAGPYSGRTCAWGEEGSARCWGDKSAAFGVGDDLNNAVTLPRLSGFIGVKSIAAGGSAICAVLQGGSVRCAGLNQYATLGAPTPADPQSTPVTVMGF